MIDTSEGGDPNLLVPDPAIVPLIDEALDQLDAGISFREAVATHNSKASRSLSHAGLKIIWDLQRQTDKTKNDPSGEVEVPEKDQTPE